jgi:hypothetical protein
VAVLRKNPPRNEISRAPCSFHHLLSLGEIFSAIYIIAFIEKLKERNIKVIYAIFLIPTEGWIGPVWRIRDVYPGS